MLYACDERWWDRYLPEVRAAEFGGELWSCSRQAHKRFGTLHIRGLTKPGLSRRRGEIHHGRNSGYQAIGLAYEFGAVRIVLVGYDMQHTDGRAHWFGNHPAGWTNAGSVAQWVHGFNELARDLAALNVDVINCTRETALTCFRRANIEDVL